MVRRSWTLLAGVLLAFSGAALTADKPDGKPAAKAPAGTWKVMLPALQKSPVWLIRLDEKDGKWSGTVVATDERLPPSELIRPSLKDGVLHFTLKLAGALRNFECRVAAPDAARMLGTTVLKDKVHPVQLERTTMTGLSRQDLNRDTVAQGTDAIEVVRAVKELLGQAAFLKAKPEEARGWIDRAVKAAEAYGPRYQQDTLLELVETLNEQDGMAAVALPYARRAERLLNARDRPALHKRTLELLATALDRVGKTPEAKTVTARIDKIDYSVRVQPFPPRTGKNNRTAVVELFTGAECPPCVAADLAFDALAKTFQPSEAILLQYHEHIPGPDPLANAQTQARMKYYAEVFASDVRSTPSTVFNGSPGAAAAGGRNAAQDKYDQFYNAIVGHLDQAAGMTLKTSAVRKGDKIAIKAEVADLKDTGMSVRLRLILVEEKVSYKGGNGLETHHCVVRAFPGGLEGKPLTAKTVKQAVTLDVDELRQQLKKGVEADFKKAEEAVPKEIPLELRKLRLVALVQDDNSREILHAVQVVVEDAR